MRGIRICAVFLLILFPVTSLAGRATEVGPSPATDGSFLEAGANPEKTLSAVDLSPDLPSALVVAQNDRQGAEATASDSLRTRSGCSWGTFWDVHFGGYRWMWWAAAGGVLIAIHAHEQVADFPDHRHFS